MIQKLQSAQRAMERILLGILRINKKKTKDEGLNKCDICNVVHKVVKIEMARPLGQKNRQHMDKKKMVELKARDAMT